MDQNQKRRRRARGVSLSRGSSRPRDARSHGRAFPRRRAEGQNQRATSKRLEIACGGVEVECLSARSGFGLEQTDELITRYLPFYISLNCILRRNVVSGAQTWIYLRARAREGLLSRACRATGPGGGAAPLRAYLRTLTSAPLPLPCASRRTLARPRPSRGGRRRASLAAPPDRSEFLCSLACVALSLWQ